MKDEQTFLEHVQELKTRIMWVVASLVVASVIGYFLHQSLVSLLLLSPTQTLYFTSPSGGLEFIIQVSLLFGLLVTIPVLTYHTVKFLEPVFPHASTRLILKVLAASLLLMITGVVFAYWTVLPAALRFLSQFSSAQVQSLVSTQEYLSFVTRYLVGFGLLFQLPLVMIMVNHVHPVSIRKLLSWQRHVIVISVVIAAILTPTVDLANQFFMAAPIILLYQISLLLIWGINRSKVRENARPAHTKNV